MLSPIGSLRLAATGAVDIDEVWGRYSEPGRWATWAPHIREVDYPHRVVMPGTNGQVSGIGGVVAQFQIDDVDHEARRWSWSVDTGPVRLMIEHGVDSDARESTAWVVTRGLWPVVLGYAPVARWSMSRLVTP